MKGRILAIDYGKKRTGLAVTDELGIIASPLETVETKNLFVFLQTYCQAEPVICFVVGQPKRLDNSDSSIAGEVKKFVANLEKLFPEKKVYPYDERFTSQMAFQAMIDGGLKKAARRDKSLVDKISATIILQSFLEYRNNTSQ